MTLYFDDIEGRMKSRLHPEWRKAERIGFLVEILAAELQEVEDTIYASLIERYLGGAEGAQLDQYGLLVDLEREGRDDDEYRLSILAKNLANKRGHLASYVGQIASVLLQSNTVKARYYTLARAAFQIDFTPDTPLSQTHLDQAFRILQEMAPAGVRLGEVVEGTTDPFALDTDGLGLDQGNLSRSITP